MIRWLLVFFVIMLGVYSYRRYESFISAEDVKKLPSPPEIISGLRKLLDRYDKPEMWNHTMNVTDKTPGELARIQLEL